MSGYILCQTEKAERPYFIENISTNIYSIEELCYYLYHNLYLIDASVINEELCMWIQQELELPKLAAKLRPKLQNYTNAEDVLYPIFKEINYLTYEELKNLNSRMALLNQESPALRQKRKGDCLVENRMYVNAIQVYQKLLEQNPDSERTDFAADVLYNLGCAYSYLFQMEKALEVLKENPLVDRVTVDGDDVILTETTASTVALIVNELVQNSLKYAFPDREEGQIQMQIERGPRYSWVTVRDDGCGFDNKKVSTSSSGLGLRLINSLVRSSLHGEIFTDSEHGGTRVRFSFRNQEEPSQVTVHG